MRVLIMAPTRELAVQIKDEFRGFARTLSLEAVLCVGGAGIVPQMATPAPWAARPSAMPRPMPLLPPVTNAVLPSSFLDI